MNERMDRMRRVAPVADGGVGPRGTELVIQWTGDIALNGPYCDPLQHAKLRENLGNVAAALGNCALRIGNWESPLWGNGGVNLQKFPRLCTTLEAASCVLPLELDVALLANNHAYDCLEAGFENTTAFLCTHGIEWLGAGRSPEEAARPLMMERGGVRFGLLDYVAADTHPSIPQNAGVAVNQLEPPRVFRDVDALAERCDVVLVHLHWGVDFMGYPTPAQRRFARELIDRGASVVIGHHPHCLQGHERWGEGHAFYSLGNFLFGSLAHDEPWPDVSLRSAVAVARFHGPNLREAYLVPFLQQGLFLEPDARPRREREEHRLCRRLSWDERRYARFWRRAYLYLGVVLTPARFIKRVGGLWAALCRLRWRHLCKLAGFVGRR
jgi:hypothetical protein